MGKKIIIDAREFSSLNKTGIGRFLEGLVDALAASNNEFAITLACMLVFWFKLRALFVAAVFAPVIILALIWLELRFRN